MTKRRNSYKIILTTREKELETKIPFRKLKRNYFLIIVLVIFTVFMGRLVYTLQRDMLALDTPVDFNEGWAMETDADQNTVVFSRQITEDMLGNVVYFYVYDSFVDAEAGGKAIYHYGQTTRYLKSPGTLWHMIPIPADTLGVVPCGSGAGVRRAAADRNG